MTFTFDLPGETARQLRADARRQGISTEDLLRRLVERTYAHQPHELPPPGFAGEKSRIPQGDEADPPDNRSEGAALMYYRRAEDWDERDVTLGIRRAAGDAATAGAESAS